MTFKQFTSALTSAVLLASSLSFAVFAEEPDYNTVYINKHTPVLDGIIDSQYYSSFHIEHSFPPYNDPEIYFGGGIYSFYETDEKGWTIVDKNGEGIYKGNTAYGWDAKASSYYLWDNDNLYVAIKVTDDDYGCADYERMVYSIGRESATVFWQDSVYMDFTFDNWTSQKKLQKVSAERAGRAMMSIFTLPEYFDGIYPAFRFVELCDPETEDIFFDIHSGWVFEYNEGNFAASETQDGYIIELRLPLKGARKSELWKSGESIYMTDFVVIDAAENSRYGPKNTLTDDLGPFNGEGGAMIDFMMLSDKNSYQMVLSDSILQNDVNLDGEINSKDLVRLMKYIANNSFVKPQDINGDGKLNSKDLVSFMKQIAAGT